MPRPTPVAGRAARRGRLRLASWLALGLGLPEIGAGPERWVFGPVGRAMAAAPGLTGAALGELTFTDVDDHQVALRSIGGRVVVLLHEDKDTGDRNTDFKDRLGLVWERHPRDLQVIALCEVSAFNFWPARRFARDALRKLQRESRGVRVLIDWKGALKARYPLPRGGSQVLILGRDGRVVLSRSGDLTPAETAEALAVVEGLIATAATGGSRP